jgi:hypothetical protein
MDRRLSEPRSKRTIEDPTIGIEVSEKTQQEIKVIGPTEWKRRAGTRATVEVEAKQQQDPRSGSTEGR